MLYITLCSSLPRILEEKLGDADAFAQMLPWMQENLLIEVHGRENMSLIKAIISSIEIVSIIHKITLLKECIHVFTA